MAVPVVKARSEAQRVRVGTTPRSEPLKKPSLARAELVDKTTRERMLEEIDGALKRKGTSEAKLAGALRALVPLSPQLRTATQEMATTLVRRKSFGRELYGSAIRSLAELDDAVVPALLKEALAADDAGGIATLSAACFSADRSLTPVLSKLAANRQSYLSFAAETARVVRGESNGAHLLAVAPMIKEAHRISLCTDLFVPLLRRPPVPRAIAPALAVLRGAERHLGRWLVLAEVAVRAGEPEPLEAAREAADDGPSSSRSAWALVAWVLESAAREVRGELTAFGTETRPTVELVARLSDRPSADRDTTFLFRMAMSKVQSAKAMLESLVRAPAARDERAAPLARDVRAVPLETEVAVRAARHLADAYGRDDLRSHIATAARTAKREEVRGVAAAALWDLGMHDEARDVTSELATSKVLSNVAWTGLIRAADARHRAAPAGGDATGPLLLTETHMRWVQWGWLE